MLQRQLLLQSLFRHSCQLRCRSRPSVACVPLLSPAVKPCSAATLGTAWSSAAAAMAPRRRQSSAGVTISGLSTPPRVAAATLDAGDPLQFDSSVPAAVDASGAAISDAHTALGLDADAPAAASQQAAAAADGGAHPDGQAPQQAPQQGAADAVKQEQPAGQEGAAKTPTPRKKGVRPPAKSPSALVLDNQEALRFKAQRIADLLGRLYPDPPIPLDHGTNFQLLCAVLLSAQTTDKKVNECTPALFALAPDAPAMAAADLADITACIRQLGLAPTKARNLKAMSQILVDEHGGEVPASLEALEALPGVGHKTASVVMCQAFGQAAFPVDTHIHRLAQRWGLTDGRSVEQTEADLKALFPEPLWKDLHLQIIFFGREQCPAQRHDPVLCPICSWAAVPPYNKAGVSPLKAGGAKSPGNGATKAKARTKSASSKGSEAEDGKARGKRAAAGVAPTAAKRGRKAAADAQA